MNSIQAMEKRIWLRAYLQYEIAPTHFMTCNFGWKTRAINAEKTLTTFFNSIQRKAYGRKWSSRSNQEWPVAYGFLEHPHSNPHYHILARMDGPMGAAASTYGEDLWLKRAPRGQLDLQPITSLPGVISYCTKRYMSDTSYESVFIYSDTRQGYWPRL